MSKSAAKDDSLVNLKLITTEPPPRFSWSTARLRLSRKRLPAQLNPLFLSSLRTLFRTDHPQDFDAKKKVKAAPHFIFHMTRYCLRILTF